MQLRGKRFFQVAQERKVNRIWAQGPHPLKSLPGPHRLKTKSSSGPTSFHFVTDGNITPFKCQDIKSCDFYLAQMKKCILLSARLPLHLPPPGYASVFRPWCEIRFSWGSQPCSSSPPVVTADSLGDEMSCSSQCTCGYTVVSQLSQQAFILVSRDYKLVKQKHLRILGCTPSLRSEPNPLE